MDAAGALRARLCAAAAAGLGLSLKEILLSTPGELFDMLCALREARKPRDEEVADEWA